MPAGTGVPFLYSHLSAGRQAPCFLSGYASVNQNCYGVIPSLSENWLALFLLRFVSPATVMVGAKAFGGPLAHDLPDRKPGCPRHDKRRYAAMIHSYTWISGVAGAMARFMPRADINIRIVVKRGFPFLESVRYKLFS